MTKRTWVKDDPQALQTVDGRLVRPHRLLTDDVNPAAMAHALGNICRFTGHVRHHYSVGQHSVYVSELLAAWDEPIEVQFAGLVHDGPEWVMGDLAGPTKKFTEYGRLFKQHEHNAENVIEDAFAMRRGSIRDPRVKAADVEMQMAEANALLPAHEWHSKANPFLVRKVLNNRWTPVPEMARSRWMELFTYLHGQREREATWQHSATTP